MSVQPPNSVISPLAGTIDVSLQSLGLGEPDDSPDTPQGVPYPSRLPSTSKGIIKRKVEQTAARLGSSVVGGGPKKEQNVSQGSRLTASLTAANPRRLVSLSRKGKGKERVNGLEDSPTPTRPSLSSRSTSPNIGQSASAPGDDSPFIRPRSPSPPPTPPPRPSLEALKSFGSMRAGTQTLIQAIQAIPWTDEPDPDDEAVRPTSMNSDSSEEDQAGPPLASSIHTIHRPIARSRKHDSPVSTRPSNGKGKGIARPTESFASSEDDHSGDSEEDEDEDEDFEATPIESHSRHTYPEMLMTGEPETYKPMEQIDTLTHSRISHKRQLMTRSSSLATIRIKRRTRLAKKLKEVFGLSEISEVIAELPCWLLRSILLQGYMYLTNSHLCFFAHMPSREDQVLKSGSLNKKTQRTKRWIKHWFVLKNNVLSWYQSSSDPYFPHGVVDLRYAISCAPFQDKGFRIRTNQKVISIMADSERSREEWVKAIRKVIFKAQNVGESVKIAIPYSVIVDVEKSTALDFSETIEVRVIDQEDQLSGNSYDSYFFAYFHNISAALDQIRDTVKTYKALPNIPSGVSAVVHDTTGLKGSPLQGVAIVERTGPLTLENPSNRLSYGSRFASLLRPFQSESSNSAATQYVNQIKPQDSASTLRQVVPLASPIPMNVKSISQAYTDLTTTTSEQDTVKAYRALSDSAAIAAKGSDFNHTYPPPPSPEPPTLPSRDSSTTVSSWGVPAWLKSPRRVFNSPSASVSGSLTSRKSISEVVSNVSFSRGTDIASSELGFSVLEAKDATEPEAAEKFRATFAFDDKEQLLGYFPGYLFRILPTYGRLFISTNYFCFKSSGPLATRTRMQLPIRDILALENTKAYRFGLVGLVVIIKGYEELFFEFRSADRRAAFVRLLEKQMEDMQRNISIEGTPTPNKFEQDALMLKESESSPMIADDDPRPPLESLADSLPAVMFTSTSSTFLTFKPQHPLHITCLTIGSRGDVQPYIALAKGLMADGHTVRIATHGEFKDWVESFGIEFAYVGGDPAELMRICVENGMFTVSFLKETMQKFRGWIDDLLITSWQACQGTDILIESPSAMAGIHIAEALKIPYYRAFTMTWTSTRAYPHAFAVPEHKMGGGYNYMSYVIFDQVFWRAIAGQINRWRRNTLKLSSTNLDKLEPHKVPFLYNFSPTVVPPPLDWPEWIRVTGYWFLDDAEVSSQKWTPPNDLVDFIDSAHQNGKKVVYVGFGSIVVSDPDAMTRCIVEAILRSGVYAILSKGWSDRLQAKKGIESTEPEIPLPPQIYQIKSIPHDWLFKRIEAACHHGGAGTTGASLRAGIPTIIRPFFGDQFFWGDRVEALGVGSCLRKLTVDSLADAFTLATTDEKQIGKAKLIGEKIRSENGVATAIESIYRDLEYARSLIRDNAANNVEEEDATIRDIPRSITPIAEHRSSADSMTESVQSEWSVVSASDDRRSSHLSGEVRGQSPTSKRKGLTAAAWSVLPNALQPSLPRNAPKS